MKRKPRQRLEEDGVYESTSDHWELLGDIEFRKYSRQAGFILIPVDLERHLRLESGDLLSIAIHHLVKRAGKIMELNPVKLELIAPVKVRRYNSSRTIIKAFLASEHLKVELDPKSYNNMSRYLTRHKEYPVSVHCSRYHTPDMFVWLEKEETATQ